MNEEMNNLQKVKTKLNINLTRMRDAIGDAFDIYHKLQDQLYLIDSEYDKLYDVITETFNIIRRIENERQ